MNLFDIKTKQDVIDYIKEHGDINYYKKKLSDVSVLFYDLSYDTMKYILETTNIDVNKVDNVGNNALFFIKNPKNVKLLSQYMDINHLNNEGQSALFYANEEVSFELIEAGIDIQHTDNQGNNASFLYDFGYGNASSYASFRDRDFKKLKLLISKGIDIKNINNYGHNILFSAYRFNKEMYQLLWDNGVDFSTKNGIKDNFLCRYGRPNKNINDLNSLMIKDIDFSYSCNGVPLLFLIINRWKSKETLPSIKDINNIIYNGLNVLSVIESINLFKYVVRNTDININFVNSQKRNILFSRNLDLKKLEFLKKEGINLFLEDNDGKTAFDFHIKTYNEQVKEKHKELKYRKKYTNHGEVAFEILNSFLGIEGLSQNKYVISLLDKKVEITADYIENIKETAVLDYLLREKAQPNKKKIRI